MFGRAQPGGGMAAIGLPFLVLGVMAGTRLRGKVSRKVFRKIALALITLAGVSGV